MIKFIYGTYGSGKTFSVISSIAKDTSEGKHTFFLVPEQEAVQSEHATLRALPHSAQLDLEVLSFSRLYNRVCREYGGLSYSYVTSPIRHLLMWQNLRELAPLLEQFGPLAGKDQTLGEVMLSAIGECKACGIAPSDLEAAADKLEKNAPLALRLRDLSLIFSSFDRLVSQNYSDSSDDLSRLRDILSKHDFFSGTNVYIDSFTSFTSLEHKIIELIFKQADNVTITIPLPSPECNDISCAGIKESLMRLCRSADLHGGHSDIILKGNRRANSPALAYLAENLWRLDTSSSDSTAYNDGSIRMEICDTPYSECEAASAYILDLLRRGERCRDIAVIVRDTEKYRGIIEPALDKNAIPFFFSRKSDLCSMPPVKLLLSALRIKQYNWQKSDILSHLKTGMYSFPERSIALFEEYIDTWNICGSRFTERDWTMNPDGFAPTLSKRASDILTCANEIRNSLCEKLTKFFILLDASRNVPDMCRAVYTYFTDIALEEKLNLLADIELAAGNKKEASDISSIYSVILTALADIAGAMSEECVDTDEFSMILKIVFEHTDIGAIPTSVDEVTVGSAAMLRVSNPKYVFILGLCEGEFPASVSDTGIFSSADRSALSELGMQLSSDADIRSSDELMYVQRAFASPSDGLFLFTSTSDANGKGLSPSLPFNRVTSLFSNTEPHHFTGSDLRYLSGSAKSASAYLRSLGSSADGKALRDAMLDIFPKTRKNLTTESSDPTCKVSNDTVKLAIGDSLRFSASKFERYVECPFSYYCTYVLGLREKKKAVFRASDIGTFIHYILEHLIRAATEKDENGNFPNDEELVRMTEKTVNEYIDKVCPDELKGSQRLRHLYTRLKRLSLLMVRNIVEEFSHSEFIPAFFELNANGKDGNPSPIRFVTDDGFSISFSGIIDRVDILKNDGNVYIRVVDYKTGTKLFSIDDVQHGINIQMLLYLFTLCRNPNPDFCRQIGLEEGASPTPAGVVYLSANIPVIQAEGYDSEEEVLTKASDSLKRSGLLLNDEDILLAMNSELSPKFLSGIKRNKDGALVGAALAEQTRFQELYDQINSTVMKIVSSLRGGNADASPLTYKSKDPCAYCDMKPICRIKNKE